MAKKRLLCFAVAVTVLIAVTVFGTRCLLSFVNGPVSLAETRLHRKTPFGLWETRNILNETCAKGCRDQPYLATFHGQSREDEALYIKYFSEPFNQCRGTFVEIGALDGVTYSITKFFEDALGWSGVLIEAFPENYAKLKKNRPNSKIIGKATCPKGQSTVRFLGKGAVGGVEAMVAPHHRSSWLQNASVVNVPCAPLGEMLRGAGVSHVDFFILDVEGAELSVLQTMDWTIQVRVFVVELFGMDKRKDAAVRSLLASYGYKKASWDITSFCRDGEDCAPNEVFENQNQHQFTC